MKSIPTTEDASTRRRVAESILEHGPSTAADLAVRLHLTTAGIRRHLDNLTASGLVEAQDQRVSGSRGRGRPAKVFVVTDAGRDSFYTSYDELAIAALRHLAESGGNAAIEEFAKHRAAQLAAGLTSSNRGGLRPVAALAEALTQAGYVASAHPAAHGEQLCQHHCPVAKVAAEFPQLCDYETRAFAEVLGVHVQRLATIAHGDGVCTTHVPDQPTMKAAR